MTFCFRHSLRTREICYNLGGCTTIRQRSLVQSRDKDLQKTFIWKSQLMMISPFASAFFGAIVGVLIIIGGFLVSDYFIERKEKQLKNADSLSSAEEILERHIEKYILEHFKELFPGWSIFDDHSELESRSGKRDTPVGVRYRTKAGEIDLLCIDQKSSLVVVELKRDRAPDRVIAQVDRYMEWVRKHLAKPDQRVRGLIITRRFDSRLFHSLQRRRDIRIWTHRWNLRFDKRPKPQ